MPEDPWRQLAIESQARQILPAHPETSPALLTLLHEESEELRGRAGDILHHEVQRLLAELQQGTFAQAIVKAIWGPEARVVDFLEDETEMDALANNVISNSGAQ